MGNLARTRFLKDEGIVLASKDFGEADKILTIFSKNFGKLEVLAKNVKKLKSRRVSACNVLSYNKFLIAKSKTTTLAESLNLDQFLEIRVSLPKLAMSLQSLEVLNFVIPLEVSYPEIFKALILFLKKLEKISNLNLAKVKLIAFEIKLLTKTGWLGDDFKVRNFSNFSHLERFLISKFEVISQKKLKSAQFAKIVLE